MTQNKWLVVGAMGLALSLCFICVAVLALALVIIPSLQSNQDVAKNETITPPRPTAGSTPSSVLSPSPSTWKLIPVVIDAAQTNDGWINYQVVLALENQSSQSAHPVLDLGFSSVETQEGYTYELQYSQAPNYLNLPLIPPQFRIRNFPGQAWTEFIIKFQVAQNTHPLRIKFSKYGNIPKFCPN